MRFNELAQKAEDDKYNTWDLMIHVDQVNIAHLNKMRNPRESLP